MFNSLCFVKMGKKFRVWLVLLFVSFTAYGQLQASGSLQSKISLKVKNVKLVDVLEEIRKQSGFNFIYNDKYVRNFEDVTLDINNSSLDKALEEVLRGTDLGYKVENNIIVLRKNNTEQAKFRKIKGVVKDERGDVLPGVTVLIKGTSIGVSTGIDGQFMLEIPVGADILQFSFIGLETQEVRVTDKTENLNVVMRSHVDELDEVVITGYTRTTKEKAVGSVAVVTKESFENKATPTMDKLLQGVVAGVNVRAKTGRPGEAAEIRIRGTNTITGDAEPLWVIDGIPLQNNIPAIKTGQIKAGDFNEIFNSGIAGINPNDIENVTILKDASAAAIYGSRAAGGVIVVTTKQGKTGKLSVNYSANVSFVMKPQHDPNLMNSREKIAWEQELWNEYSDKGFKNGTYYPTVGLVGMVRSGKENFTGMNAAEQDTYLQQMAEVNTDWIDMLFRTAISQNHYLSLSGGQNAYTYYMSFGYSKDNGVVKKTDYDRYNVSGKMNIRPNERWNVQLGFDLAKQQSNGPSMVVDPFKYAYFANPYEKAYNEDGSYAQDLTYFNLVKVNGGYDVRLPANGFNIMREIDQTSGKADNLSVNLRFNLDYNITDKLMFTGLGSYSYINNKMDNINGKETYAAYQDRFFFDSNNKDRIYGSITQSAANNSNYSMRGQLSYHNTFLEEHRVSVLVGSEIRQEKIESIYEKRYGYDPVTGNSSVPLPPRPAVGNEIDYDQVVAYGSYIDQLMGQSITENRFASFYASLDYDFRTKYILGVSFRTDGSNNFGSDEQFNPTWAVGAAWHIGKEAFMESLKPVLSNLSLKLSTGYTGNINKSVKPNLIMDYLTTFRKTYEDSYRMGTINNPPNPRLRWEKTRDMKISLDFGLFDNRISGLVEAYYRLSSDVVTKVRIPYTTGFTDQSFNTSKIENKGIEGTVNFQILKTKNYKVGMTANIAWNRNKLKEYISINGINYSSEAVGYPLGAVFGGKTTGIDPETGIYKFQLRPDAEINRKGDLTKMENYMFYLGTSNAPVTGGFSLSASYKNLSVSVGGNYSLGARILNKVNPPVNSSQLNDYIHTQDSYERIPTRYNDLFSNHVNVPKDVTDRWTSSRRTGVKYPRLIDPFGERLYLDAENPTSSEITNGALLENVSYLRINNVTVSYSLPQNIIKKTLITSLGVFASVNNIMTVTNYSGIDPETPGAVYPPTRSVTVGINVAF